MKVLISEDASFVRERYAHLIRQLPSVTSVIETCDVKDTVQVIRDERPDVALLDFHLPAGTALDVMRDIADDGTRPRLFVLSASSEEVPVDQCMSVGAERIFNKAAQLLEALSAVRAIAIEYERLIRNPRTRRYDHSSEAGARGADNA